MAIAQPTAPRIPRVLLAGIAAALAMLALGGAWFYRTEARSAHQQAVDQLASIARLKSNQIAAWRRDRLQDARELTESPFLAAGVARYLEAPDDARPGAAAALLRTRLTSIQRQQDYADVVLVDARRHYRMGTTGYTRTEAGYELALTEAWRTGRPAVTDLHIEHDGDAPHIAVVAPILSPSDPRQPIAAFILVTDANRFLYPLISAWPIPSPTAETVMIRRDGDDALILSHLRYRDGAALRMRTPLDRVDLPAVQAALGHEGVFEGPDYRGAQVVSVVVKVPDSPWALVAKVDQLEAFASWRRRAALIVLQIVGLITGVLLLGVVAWEQTRKNYYRMLHESDTQLRATVDALRDSEARFRTLFEASNDAILLLESGRVLQCNAEAVRIFGADSPAHLLGQSPVQLSPEFQPDGRRSADAGPDWYQQAFERGTVSFSWTHTRLSSGKPFPAEVTLSRLSLDGKDVLQATLRDITERVQAAHEQERLQAQLLQAQKMESVGRLAGGVAHDFNNMLGAILGYTELAIEKTLPSDPVHADLLEVQTAARRSADLTRQLLAFARKQTIAPRVLDLNETVSGLLKMLRRLIGEDIALVWRPGAGTMTVRMDPSQIDQVLANLCVNARDAIGGVGRVMIATDTVSLGPADIVDRPGATAGAFVRLSVSDDGSGMDQHVIDHLFEPFFTTKRLGEGTGLGLATVYGIVKQNDGFIEVTSAPGAGTTFDIYLPGHADEPAARHAAGTSTASRGHETILIVEDELAVLRMAASALSSLGYRVLTAASPAEAMAAAENQDGPIDLLLTDVVMPGMNGRDLASALAGRRPGLSCLFMSGYTADVIAHRGVLDEGVRFIQKPFTIRQLATGVRAALDGRAGPLPPGAAASRKA